MDKQQKAVSFGWPPSFASPSLTTTLLEWYYFLKKVMEATMESALTSKGQATIPKAIRDHLGVSAGSRIKFFEHPDGSVYILPVRTVQALRGVLKYTGKTISLEEMDNGIAQAVTARDRRSRR
jgi:antitoxin PrlF